MDNMTEQEFLEDMRTYKLDHEPDGWPAVQQWKIDKLIAIIDDLKQRIDDMDENANWLSFAHTLCTDLGVEQGHITWRIEQACKAVDNLKRQVEELCDGMTIVHMQATRDERKRCAEIAKNYFDSTVSRVLRTVGENIAAAIERGEG